MSNDIDHAGKSQNLLPNLNDYIALLGKPFDQVRYYSVLEYTWHVSVAIHLHICFNSEKPFRCIDMIWYEKNPSWCVINLIDKLDKFPEGWQDKILFNLNMFK